MSAARQLQCTPGGKNWNDNTEDKTRIHALLTNHFHFLDLHCKRPITKFDNYTLTEGMTFSLCTEGKQRWEIILSKKIHTAL